MPGASYPWSVEVKGRDVSFRASMVGVGTIGCAGHVSATGGTCDACADLEFKPQLEGENCCRTALGMVLVYMEEEP